MPFLQTHSIERDLNEMHPFRCGGIQLQYLAGPIPSDSECSCEDCMEAEEEEFEHVLRYSKEKHSPKAQKDNEMKQKRLENFQRSIQSYLKEIDLKQKGNQVRSEIEKDSFAQQKNHLEILEAELKSKELEIFLLQVNARKLSSNIQFVQDEIRLNGFATTNTHRSPNQSSAVSHNTRTVVI